MADYAGAVAAMRARFVAAFVAAPVCFQNEQPAQQPWPPDGPWTYFEVIQTETRRRGVGLPGNDVWITVGNIFVHVFAPKGYGLPQHLAIAEQAAAIFRSATFYNSDPGAAVRCWSDAGAGPSVRGADKASDDGNWLNVVVTIPFQFYFTA